MLSRIPTSALRGASCRSSSLLKFGTQTQRNYATLKEVEMRLKSIKNIEKITKTMKIVASTRLSKAEKAKATAKIIDDTESQYFKNAETEKVKLTEEQIESYNKDTATEEKSTETNNKNKELIIAITSDKGLCGSIHSSLARKVRNYLRDENANADIVTIGDKIKTQILRSHPNNLKLSFNGIGKDAPTFQESALITSKIIQELNADKYLKISIFYNNPISSISFEPTEKPIFTSNIIEHSPSNHKFSIVSNENVSKDLFEFSFTNQILTALAKGYAAEISARRNAMDNASKNAGDMINRYSILYNRTRQAVITNELVDIITGASSLE